MKETFTKYKDNAWMTEHILFYVYLKKKKTKNRIITITLIIIIYY